jgi:hypothetical protein
MAEGISREEMRELFKEFFGGSSGGGGGGGGGSFKTKDLEDTLKDVQKRFQSTAVASQKAFGATNTFLNVFNKSSQEARESLSNMNRSIDEIDDVLRTHKNNLTDSQKKQLEANKQEMQRRVASSESVSAYTSALGSAFAGAAKTLVSTVTNIASTIAGGGSGFAIAGSIAEAQIDITNQANQGLASAAQTSGAAMMGMGGRAKAAGMGLMALGTVAGFASDALSTFAKAGVKIMIAEGEKVINTYKNMANNGVIFGNGLQGMGEATRGTKLRLEDMAEVVSQNREAFGRAGIGMTEATKRVGAVAKAMATSKVDRELLALGYSYKDQAAMSAETLATMRMARGGANVTNQQVAEATKKYAENLTLIASITGEDIKAKQAKIADENANLAMEAKIAEMDPKQATEFRASLAAMTETQRKAVRDQMIFGTIRDKDAALLMATNSGFRKSVGEITEAQKAGRLSTEETLRINNKYSAEMRDEALKRGKDLGAAAYAGGESAQALAKTQYEMSQSGILYAANAKEEAKRQKEAQDKAREADPSKPTTDPTQAMFQSIEAGAELSKKLQEKVISNLSIMPNLLAKYYAEIEKLIDNMADGGQSATGWLEKLTMGLMLAQTALSLFGLLKGKVPKLPGMGTTVAKPAAPRMTPSQLSAYKANRVAGMPAMAAKEAATAATQTGPGGVAKALAGSADDAAKAAAGSAIKSTASGALKKLPLIGTLLTAGSAAMDVSATENKLKAGQITKQEARKEQAGSIGEAGGALAGGAAGAKMGAVIGTFIAPGIGTAVGGVLGGVIGSIAGAWGGKKAGTAAADAAKLGTTPNTAATAKPPAMAEQAKAKVEAEMKAKLDADRVAADAKKKPGAAKKSVEELLEDQNKLIATQNANAAQAQKLMMSKFDNMTLALGDQSDIARKHLRASL